MCVSFHNIINCILHYAALHCEYSHTFEQYSNISTTISTMMIRMIDLSFLMLLSRMMIQTNAAGLRATNKNNTRREEKQLRLTDDDTIEFFKEELEMGYLDRDRWEKVFISSSLVEENDDEDDDHGGFLFEPSTNTDPATGNFIGASLLNEYLSWTA